MNTLKDTHRRRTLAMAGFAAPDPRSRILRIGWPLALQVCMAACDVSAAAMTTIGSSAATSVLVHGIQNEPETRSSAPQLRRTDEGDRATAHFDRNSGVDAPQARRDWLLVRQAIGEGWPVPEAVRWQIAALVCSTGLSSPNARMRLAAVLAMEHDNMDAEREAIYRPR